ncbi:MAG TPA: (Na+)-NQR maturation NqrM [Pseudomonadales bacterium]|nr:(Na+)-NQR maturation NqrM [Pseudomonadales bacterium]
MTTFIVALVVVLLLVAGMAVGVLMGREPIKGSCGGIAALGIDTECEICGGNPHLCETEQKKAGAEKAPAADLSYDATKR